MIEDHQVEGASRGCGSAQFLERGPGSVRGAVRQVPRQTEMREQFSVRGVVVHDQHVTVPEVRRRGRRLRQRIQRVIQRRGEPECRSALAGALHANLSAHEFGEPLADRQAQTGAAKPPRGGGVGLHERLEEIHLHGGRHADARIRDREAQHMPAVPAPVGRDMEHDFALGGELDRVADEVEDDLAQTHGIAAHPRRHLRIDVHHEFEPLGARGVGVEVERQLEMLPQVEVDRFEGEPSGLDFREIEDVVDDRQQRFAAVAQRVGEVPLLRGELGRKQQICHADDAVHRGADLVAHVGEKRALRAIRALCRVLGSLQIDLHREPADDLLL